MWLWERPGSRLAPSGFDMMLRHKPSVLNLQVVFSSRVVSKDMAAWNCEVGMEKDEEVAGRWSVEWNAAWRGSSTKLSLP